MRPRPSIYCGTAIDKLVWRYKWSRTYISSTRLGWDLNLSSPLLRFQRIRRRKESRVRSESLGKDKYELSEGFLEFHSVHTSNTLHDNLKHATRTCVCLQIVFVG